MRLRSNRLIIISNSKELSLIAYKKDKRTKGVILDNQISSAKEYEDGIDLGELFTVLWSGKVKIMVITAVFAVGSVIYALSIPNQYKATALLAPAQSNKDRKSVV